MISLLVQDVRYGLRQLLRSPGVALFTTEAAALLILAVAWAACELPALRARRVDPVIALRSE